MLAVARKSHKCGQPTKAKAKDHNIKTGFSLLGKQDIEKSQNALSKKFSSENKANLGYETQAEKKN